MTTHLSKIKNICPILSIDQPCRPNRSQCRMSQKVTLTHPLPGHTSCGCPPLCHRRCEAGPATACSKYIGGCQLSIPPLPASGAATASRYPENLFSPVTASRYCRAFWTTEHASVPAPRLSTRGRRRAGGTETPSAPPGLHWGQPEATRQTGLSSRRQRYPSR